MKAINISLSAFLLFVLFTGCKKEEEVTSPRVIEVTENGVAAPVTVGRMHLGKYHRGLPGEHSPVLVELYFSVAHADEVVNFRVSQWSASDKLSVREFPAMQFMQTVPDYHTITATNYKEKTISNSRFEVHRVDRENARISVNYSFTLHHNGNATNITGRLENIPYDTSEE